MENIRFGCGEFLPGKRPIGPNPPPIPVPIAPIKIPGPNPCCTRVPGPPAIPDPPPQNEWTCVCEAECPDSPGQCLEGRGCIPRSSLRVGQRHGRFFPSLQACVAQAFNEAPCWRCGAKCVETIFPCPPPFQHMPRLIAKDCVQCPPAASHAGTDCARFPSVRECRISCREEVFNCPVIIGPPDIGPGPVPPRPITPGPGPSPRPIDPPFTPQSWFKCLLHEIVYCPEPWSHIEHLVSQECVLCWTDIGLGNGLGKLPGGGIGPRPIDCIYPRSCPGNSGYNGMGCRTIILNDCPEDPEIPDPDRGGGGSVTGVIYRPPGDLTGVQYRPPVGGGGDGGTVISPRPLPDNSLTSVQYRPPELIDDGTGGYLRDGGSQILGLGNNGFNLNHYLNSFNSTTLKVNQIDLDVEAQSKSVSHEDEEIRSIYHRKFNLFNYTVDKKVEFTDNNKYLNLFRDKVTKEVAYALRIADTSGVWKEYPYSQLTKEKIVYSLRSEVLKCLSNLHFQDSTKIPLDYFVETILRLLVIGRLDDFDFEYYQNLEIRQSQDTFIEFKPTPNVNFKEQAALGIISQYAVTVDPSLISDLFTKNKMKRSRRLNTDIEAYIPIKDFDNVVNPLPLEDSGVKVELLDPGVPVDFGSGGPAYAPLGDGHGYYISATLDTGEVIPLETTNLLSSTFYIPPGIRDQVLGLFGVDSSIRLRTYAPIGMSEFDLNYDNTTELSPMYFTLNLSSVGDLFKKNQLVRSFSGSYVLETDQEVIDEHTKNYGLNIAKIYLDYDDPFLPYALQSGQVDFEQADISFNDVTPNKGAVESQILSRHVDFGIILIPTKGSKFNPFFGRSKLTNFTAPYGREISVITNIDKSDTEPLAISLKEENLTNLTGARKIGLVEEENVHNVIYRYEASSLQYSGLSYSNGEYTNTFPDRERPSFGKIVYETIETNLSANYGPLSSITWWDVFRRLPFKDIAELALNVNSSHIQQLASGSRGYKIRHVLQREGATGTLVSTTVTDDVILNEEDREDPTIYYA